MYVMADNAIIKAPGTGLVQRYSFDQAQAGRMRGMGCGCAGLAGCPCGGKTGGLGLFESGMDFAQWGGVEWALVALGGYVALSTISTTKRASRRVSSAVSGAYKGARRSNPGRRRRRR